MSQANKIWKASVPSWNDEEKDVSFEVEIYPNPTLKSPKKRKETTKEDEGFENAPEDTETIPKKKSKKQKKQNENRKEKQNAATNKNKQKTNKKNSFLHPKVAALLSSRHTPFMEISEYEKITGDSFQNYQMEEDFANQGNEQEENAVEDKSNKNEKKKKKDKLNPVEESQITEVESQSKQNEKNKKKKTKLQVETENSIQEEENQTPQTNQNEKKKKRKKELSQLETENPIQEEIEQQTNQNKKKKKKEKFNEEDKNQIQEEKKKNSIQTDHKKKSTNKVEDLTPLQKQFQEKLEGSRFRWINEILYTTNSKEALQLFQQDPSLYEVYHKGFQTQVEKWPANPLDGMIEYIKRQPTNFIIGDFGCGEARLAQSVPHKVHSFDLVPYNDYITVADCSNVPLPSESIHIAVFCLSLMGTNLQDFFKEAHRVLKSKGVLKIAEVKSRFDDYKSFKSALISLGFDFVSQDDSNNVFVLFEFTKSSRKPKINITLSLKPCLYKKR